MGAAVMFKADTYRVMIASPSDLPEERQIATNAINEWNALHSAAESVVLLPVKWETHATPTSGARPQQAINDQLVAKCDIVLGMFWTKIGTSTGVAESGTVEEIDQFVAAAKPALLYFSSRPIDPNKIDMKQHKKLKAFKSATYKKALVGSFSRLEELRQTLIRDLTAQVRKIKPKRLPPKLEEAAQITELIRTHRKHKITPEEFKAYRDEIIGLKRRSKAQTTDPVPPGEVGPNGYPIGYDDDGNKVEFLPDDENPGETWPMILRRNDKEILETHQKFWDIRWWNHHQVWAAKVKSGNYTIPKAQKEIFQRAEKSARRIERKYGKKNLILDTYHWGLLSGRASALAWVLGAEWDESLDT
jgi:hypothetical protein